MRLERLLRSEGQMKTWFYRRLYKEIPAILIVWGKQTKKVLKDAGFPVCIATIIDETLLEVST